MASESLGILFIPATAVATSSSEVSQLSCLVYFSPSASILLDTEAWDTYRYMLNTHACAVWKCGGVNTQRGTPEPVRDRDLWINVAYF